MMHLKKLIDCFLVQLILSVCFTENM